MRITLFISSLSGGGAERVVANLANYLSEKNDVTILLFSNIISYDVNENVKVKPLYKKVDSKLPHIAINIIKVINLIKYLLFTKTDLYVSFLPKLSILLLHFKPIIKVPIIIAERCDPLNFCSASRKNKFLFKKYYKKANGYIFQTNESKKIYENMGFNTINSIVIPNAINNSFIKAKSKNYNKSTKTIISVGRMTQQKNFELLINSFAKFQKKYDDYKLIIYGEGPLLDHYKKIVNEKKIETCVFFPGYTNEMEKKLIKGDVFVLSSNYEGMPNALMEAMALGLPVISTDCPVGGPKFLIKNNENGILIPMNSEQALINAITKIVSNNSFAEYIGNNAKKIKKDLEPSRIYGEWSNFFEAQIKKNKE